MSPRIYLDACAIIDIREKPGSIPALLRQLLLTPDLSSRALVTSELSLAEVLVHPVRSIMDEDPTDQNDEMRRRNAWYQENLNGSDGIIETGTITRSILISAALLRARIKSIKLPDAIHAATAIDMQASHFVSRDKQLIKCLDDSMEKAGSTPLTFVFADEASLHKLLTELQA